MSAIETARQNKINQQKAEQFDALQRNKREQDLYNAGVNDAYTSVEQELSRRYQTSYTPPQPVANPSISEGLAGWSNGVTGTNQRSNDLQREIETLARGRQL